MADRAEDIEGGPKIVLSVLVWLVVVFIGSFIIYVVWNNSASFVAEIVFLVLAGIGWGIAVGTYQSRVETRAKTR